MKIAAIVRSYHNTDFLEYVLDSLRWVDKILVVNCLHEGYDPAPDDTEEIVKRLNQPNVSLLKLQPRKEHEVLNVAIAHLEEYERILICDADEIIQKEDWLKLMKLGHYDCALSRMIDVMPDGTENLREHRPVVVVKPDCHFTFQRCIADNYKMFEVPLRHYGYLVKNIKWKKDNYEKMDMNEPIRYW